MAKFTLAFLLLPISAIGQAVPKHVYLVGGCSETAKQALSIFATSKVAPEFNLYIICNLSQWHVLAIKNDFKEQNESFTVLHKGMIWLGPKSLEHLPKAISHELEHLRCDCDLGESE